MQHASNRDAVRLVEAKRRQGDNNTESSVVRQVQQRQQHDNNARQPYRADRDSEIRCNVGEVGRQSTITGPGPRQAGGGSDGAHGAEDDGQEETAADGRGGWDRSSRTEDNSDHRVTGGGDIVDRAKAEEDNHDHGEGEATVKAHRPEHRSGNRVSSLPSLF